jgi:hypothetical protein
LDLVEEKMKEWYELKVKARLGSDPQDDKETDMLGRIVRCTAEAFEYEADPRHRRKVLEVLGLTGKSKRLTVNGRAEELEEDAAELDASEVTSFRALAARLNSLAQDSPDLQFSAKEICRDMSKPSQASWKKLKVLARFLLERESVVWKFDWQEEDLELSLYSDSDWAGCRRSRRSTRGGAVLLGGTA